MSRFRRAAVWVKSGNSAGSGVIVAHRQGQAFVLTARHVIGSGQLSATLADGRTVPGTDPRFDRYGYDLAGFTISIDDPPGVAPIAEEAAAQGETVFLCGFGGNGRPLANWKELAGRVLGYTPGNGRHHGMELAITAKAISGDSGGPIYNAAGQVVGILWGGPVSFGSNLRFTQCAAVPALRDFARRCGWLIGPEINITQPPAGPSTPQIDIQTPLLGAKVEALERDLSDIKQRARQWDLAAQRLSDYESYVKSRLPQIEQIIDSLKNDNDATRREIAKLAATAIEDGKRYDQTIAALRMQWEKDEAARLAALQDVKALADKAAGGVADARLENADTKSRLAALQAAYNTLPDEIKQRISADVHAKLDGKLGPEAVTAILSTVDSKLSGRDLAIGGSFLGIVGAIALTLIRRKNPTAAAIVERVALPAARQFRRRIFKQKDGTETVIEEPESASPVAGAAV